MRRKVKAQLIRRRKRVQTQQYMVDILKVLIKSQVKIRINQAEHYQETSPCLL